MRSAISTLLISISFLCNSQTSLNDSLSSRSFQELEKDFNQQFEIDRNKAKKIASIYRDKAFKTQDSFRLSIYYFWQSRLIGWPNRKQIKIWDSAIKYGKKIKEEHYPEMLYNKRALAYGSFGYFNDQLKDYITALHHAKKNKNQPYISIIRYNIGDLKRKLGKYNEAKEIFNETLLYDRKNMITNSGKWDTIYYLQSLSELVAIYRLSDSTNKSRNLNNEGLKLSKKYDVKVLFELEDGILDYKANKNSIAKKKLQKVEEKFTTLQSTYKPSFQNLIELNLYLGLTSMELEDSLKGIHYLKKVDSISDNANFWIPESITAHKNLVNFYKSRNDKTNQLKYINKLLKSDSILNSNYRIVGDQLLKEFDTKELLAEKEMLINSLKRRNFEMSQKTVLITILLFISILLASFYFYRQQLYKKRFSALMKAQNKSTKIDQNNNADKLPISAETINQILESLDSFEEKQEFLDTNINLVELAKRFNSNSNYLSKVINTFKEKNFTQYINDLRVEYVIEKLKKDSVFRKYTVVALGKEIGFKNAESFSKAFYKKTGIYPSYFIKELLKED